MQHIFKRYEKKYLISAEQAAIIETAISGTMTPDQYDSYWVQNLYFDTDNWDVIHTSMQKPFYKEKMRLRYYGILGESASRYAFLELKKKYAGIVYKRRISVDVQEILLPLSDVLAGKSTQIAKELDFYIKSAAVSEKMFIAFQRRAFAGKDDAMLRVTLDSGIRYRTSQLHFYDPGEGYVVLHENQHLLEIKTDKSIPFWLARLCNENGIYPASYSKYAACYTDYCRRNFKEMAVI